MDVKNEEVKLYIITRFNENSIGLDKKIFDILSGRRQKRNRKNKWFRRYKRNDTAEQVAEFTPGELIDGR